jgi:hypothetical protein
LRFQSCNPNQSTTCWNDGSDDDSDAANHGGSVRVLGLIESCQWRARAGAAMHTHSNLTEEGTLLLPLRLLFLGGPQQKLAADPRLEARVVVPALEAYVVGRKARQSDDASI